MNFGEALDSSLVKKYKTFGGRACRAEWYYFQIFSVLLAVIVASVTGIIAGTSIDPNAIRDLSQEELTDYLVDSGSFNVVIYSTVVISALLFLPSISVTVRRLQDLNITYFWALPYFITYILGFYVILNQGEENAERLNSISSLVFIVYLLVFAKKGDYKKNRFGENPLEKES